MNKKELSEAVQADIGLSDELVRRVMDSMARQIIRCLIKGESVDIRRFGRFTTRKRAARWGRNARTGVRIRIPAIVVAKFTPAYTFKMQVRAVEAAEGSGDAPGGNDELLAKVRAQQAAMVAKAKAVANVREKPVVPARVQGPGAGGAPAPARPAVPKKTAAATGGGVPRPAVPRRS